jgi:hypothetical protein
MPDRVELITKTWVFRADQVAWLERLRAERPGASMSDIVRDVVDYGFLPYEAARARLLAAPEPSIA